MLSPKGVLLFAADDRIRADDVQLTRPPPPDCQLAELDVDLGQLFPGVLNACSE